MNIIMFYHECETPAWDYKIWITRWYIKIIFKYVSFREFSYMFHIFVTYNTQLPKISHVCYICWWSTKHQKCHIFSLHVFMTDIFIINKMPYTYFLYIIHNFITNLHDTFLWYTDFEYNTLLWSIFAYTNFCNQILLTIRDTHIF